MARKTPRKSTLKQIVTGTALAAAALFSAQDAHAQTPPNFCVAPTTEAARTGPHTRPAIVERFTDGGYERVGELRDDGRGYAVLFDHENTEVGIPADTIRVLLQPNHGMRLGNAEEHRIGQTELDRGSHVTYDLTPFRELTPDSTITKDDVTISYFDKGTPAWLARFGKGGIESSVHICAPVVYQTQATPDSTKTTPADSTGTQPPGNGDKETERESTISRGYVGLGIGGATGIELNTNKRGQNREVGSIRDPHLSYEITAVRHTNDLYAEGKVHQATYTNVQEAGDLELEVKRKNRGVQGLFLANVHGNWGLGGEINHHTNTATGQADKTTTYISGLAGFNNGTVLAAIGPTHYEEKIGLPEGISRDRVSNLSDFEREGYGARALIRVNQGRFEVGADAQYVPHEWRVGANGAVHMSVSDAISLAIQAGAEYTHTDLATQESRAGQFTIGGRLQRNIRR